MAILLFAEHDNAALSEQTAKALSAAAQIGGDVDILVAGAGVSAVAEQASKLAGVRSVLVAEDDALANHLAENAADLIVSLAGDYDTIVAAATANGKNILPRVAALLDVMQVSEVMEVVDADTFKRPIYAGNAIEVVQSTDAKIIVSGGRALGSEEKFKAVITPLADKLGAAVGASRAAVDAGYAPNDLQVGQTGKVVAPDLYIACGISGAIQHLAGMKDSKIIVAINTDEEAPIFQVADYGIVGDLFDILPQLENQL